MCRQSTASGTTAISKLPRNKLFRPDTTFNLLNIKSNHYRLWSETQLLNRMQQSDTNQNVMQFNLGALPQTKSMHNKWTEPYNNKKHKVNERHNKVYFRFFKGTGTFIYLIYQIKVHYVIIFDMWRFWISKFSISCLVFVGLVRYWCSGLCFSVKRMKNTFCSQQTELIYDGKRWWPPKTERVLSSTGDRDNLPCRELRLKDY